MSSASAQKVEGEVYREEKEIKEFMQSSLKIPQAKVNEITFHSVHHLTFKDNKKPPPIIPKFEHYKHKKTN